MKYLVAIVISNINMSHVEALWWLRIDYEHWIEDMNYNTRVKNEEGYPTIVVHIYIHHRRRDHGFVGRPWVDGLSLVKVDLMSSVMLLYASGHAALKTCE